MGLFGFLKKGGGEEGAEPLVRRRVTAEGVFFTAVSPGAWGGRDPAVFGPDRELAAFLLQAEDEGFATLDADALFVSWRDGFRLMESVDHAESFSLLGLPPVEPWRPVLASSGSLTDPDFSIHIDGWKAPDGSAFRGEATVEGALLKVAGRTVLLSRVAWETAEAVFAFRKGRQRVGGGDADSNRRAWSHIWAKAISAAADLSDFLARTVVLTPERLDIKLRKADARAGNVVEVLPGFEGQPPRWLEMFDRFGEVPERYEIPDGEGMTHVLVSPEVRTVLRELKRMPGRRVAGDRAEAFLRNPFALLGPDASAVVDPAQFERAREEAGIVFARFTAHVRRDAHGDPFETGLLVEESVAGAVRGELVRFEGPGELAKFLGRLDARIATGSQCCHWEGFDLEILGDTPGQAETLRAALADLERPKGASAAELLDLSRYSERVAGFGVEKPYYSPFIARKNGDAGWFPENVEFGVLYTPEGGGETVPVSLDGENMAGFREALSKAKEEKRETFDFPGCPKPITVAWAEETLGTFSVVGEDLRRGAFDPGKAREEEWAGERKGLVVKPNVDTLDYEERRGELVSPDGELPAPPVSLRPGMSLKDHQSKGLAWLLHLWSRSPGECRGALLADDMGLGKTLQLLSFMANILERNPEAEPFLVVAPVSLLENWGEEIERFFESQAFRVLTLYGDALSRKRLPKEAVDAELAGQGITRLLRYDWLGDANLVLTTYETLRDLEFSLASQKWSAMVCDEAQKIKNPNAMVTRAAKKQNARFKIACTGTPVENTLTDLWCLFDFVQPGLLGPLKDFGERYRKPIEAETEEEKVRVEELRAIIEPQKLRRMKADVARDLPRKIEVPECRSLPLSDRQRALYADAVGSFRNRVSGGGISSHLGLLQYLRRLCSDPRPFGMLATDATPVAEIERHSPKMAWLVKVLSVIRERGEKAIVFCEFRDLQRTLQRVVTERFGVTPDIINGDTSASSGAANSRQKRIKAFQERGGFGVIILSPLAVGFGVNIQAANHVIHFTRTWNPAKEDQATDRAYRIGQSRDVHVYYPVVVAKDFLTFDAKLDALLEWKRGLSTDMLNGTGELTPADFGDLGAPGGGSAFGDEFITRTEVEALDADAFEAFCAILWSKHGYRNTRRTPRTGDGGVDVVAISGTEGVLIQCKSSSVEGKDLGWEAVKDVVAGAAGYAAQYPGVKFSRVAVTNRRFNETARAQAVVNDVELVDCSGLIKRLEKCPVKKMELISYLE
ncbi:MAG: restriction endonuclease [Magnetococcales bacterium]|nr:restriction endonuclease [Magnetococcales bacterium]